MVSRKRAREEMEAEEPAKEPSTLDKLRNMWEFASLMQYIFLFGKVVKIDEDLDIEVPQRPAWISTAAIVDTNGGFDANDFTGARVRVSEASALGEVITGWVGAAQVCIIT